MNRFVQKLRSNLKLILAIVIPLLASIIPIIFRNKPSYCAFVMLVMIFYWLTECIPVAMTSLLPVLLFPLFGILSSKAITQIYFQDILMLFFGVIVLANAFKKSGLHEKISLKVIMMFGSDPKWILLAIMLITSFLSLWLPNNESAAIMMLPITILIVKEFVRFDKSLKVLGLGEKNGRLLIKDECQCKCINEKVKTEEPKEEKLIDEELIEERIQFNQPLCNCSNENDEETSESKDGLNVIKCFSLGVGYSAIIGGSGSLIGGTTNILLKGYFDEKYPNDGLNFLSFMLFSLPVSLMTLILSWIALCYLWLPKRYWFKFACRRNERSKKDNGQSESLETLIKSNYEKLNPLNWEQISTASFFFILVILWLTRDLYYVKGWNYFFDGPKEKFVSDTTPVIFILLIMSIWPKENIFKGKPYEQLINWKNVQEFFPWHIILFAGGSLALARGFQKSDLSIWIGQVLQHIMPPQKELALLLIIILSEIGTEFICNCSIASILLPIIDSLAKKNVINHFYLLIPTILSINLSFMLPMATPTNAIIFASGYVKTKDMIISGGVIKLIGFALLMLASNTWLYLIFDTSTSLMNENIRFNNSTNGSIAF